MENMHSKWSRKLETWCTGKRRESEVGTRECPEGEEREHGGLKQIDKDGKENQAKKSRNKNAGRGTVDERRVDDDSERKL